MTTLKTIKQIALTGLKSSGAFSLVQQGKWRQDRLLILAYHGISLADEHEWDPALFMHPDYFRERLTLLRKWGCTVLPLGEAVERLYANDLPENAVALTFDDGYYNYYKVVHPILKEFNFPATVYLTTFHVYNNRPVKDAVCSYMLWKKRDAVVNLRNVIGHDEAFHLSNEAERMRALDLLVKHTRQRKFSLEEKRQIAANLADELGLDYEGLVENRLLSLLTPEEVTALSADGADIQLHTHRHRSPLDRDLFFREIRENREFIREMTGKSPTHFCYPSGIYDDAFIPWLRELDVRSATTCEVGFSSRSSERLLLPRLVDSMTLSPVEFEGWLTGVSAALPQRHRTYNVGVREADEERTTVSVHG
ncbi:MAG: polysaccharide deacetylase family protein [Blastocatellia bacterium]|nr:polysaccharide deacetylase family protein [Blastocatellia bacterium]